MCSECFLNVGFGLAVEAPPSSPSLQSLFSWHTFTRSPPPHSSPLILLWFVLARISPPSLPFCPTSNFFCTALVHSPSIPCGYCCSSVHTNACVCVSASVCSLMLLTVLLTTSSTVQLNLELLNQHIQVLLYVNNWVTGPLYQDMLPSIFQCVLVEFCCYSGMQ